MSDHIEVVDLEEQFKEDYLGFGMYVNKDRALPDVRDGLKPVQRRTLYSLFESGLLPNKPFQRSARVVGNVMGKYHPHGDSGIYDAVKTMARWWRTPLPYIEGWGNFGNIQGNDAAAMRYTQVRLSPYGLLLTEGLNKGSTNYIHNYDDSELEPETLPIQFPNLLINGSFGIGVGMRSDCLPHNPVEAVQVVIAYLNNPAITVEELMDVLPGPDFPSGGVLLESDSLLNYYKHGQQRITITGQTVIEGNKVVITEVPWQLSGSSESLKDDIYNLIEEKDDKKVRLLNARKVEDFSDKNGIRIEVTAKTKADVENLERELYAKTRLTSRMTGIFLVIHEGGPKIVNLLEYLDIYTNYQHKIVIKEHQTLLNKANQRLEIVEGLLKANEYIDVVIEVIRNAKTPKAIERCLMKGDVSGVSLRTKKNTRIASRFAFTQKQTEAILSMQLRRLSNLDQDRLTKEEASLHRSIKQYEGMIQSQVKRRNLIIKQHEALLEMFKDHPRRTILSDQSVQEYEDEVVSEPLSAHIDRFGYIKVFTEETKKEDEDVYHYNTITTDEIGFFASDAKFYKLKLDEIRMTQSRGVSIAGTLGLTTEDYLFMGPTGSPILFSQADGSHLFVTRDGLAKKVPQNEFPSVRRETVATRLREGDALIYAGQWLDKDYLVFVSENGLVKRIESKDINDYGKNSQGRITSAPSRDDAVTAVYQVDEDDVLELFGRKVKVGDIPLQSLNHTMKALSS